LGVSVARLQTFKSRTTDIAVKNGTKRRLKSLTARGMSGYKQSSKNLPNWLISGDEFVPSNR
jgi:hypothetical protein